MWVITIPAMEWSGWRGNGCSGMTLMRDKVLVSPYHVRIESSTLDLQHTNFSLAFKLTVFYKLR